MEKKLSLCANNDCRRCAEWVARRLNVPASSLSDAFVNNFKYLNYFRYQGQIKGGSL